MSHLPEKCETGGQDVPSLSLRLARGWKYENLLISLRDQTRLAGPVWELGVKGIRISFWTRTLMIRLGEIGGWDFSIGAWKEVLSGYRHELHEYYYNPETEQSFLHLQQAHS
jgi:hypothetical protein